MHIYEIQGCSWEPEGRDPIGAFMVCGLGGEINGGDVLLRDPRSQGDNNRNVP